MKRHLQEPHCTIRAVGGAASFQGQGPGTALLQPSERSAALYERLGFAHLGELQVPDGPRASGMVPRVEKGEPPLLVLAFEPGDPPYVGYGCVEPPLPGEPGLEPGWKVKHPPSER